MSKNELTKTSNQTIRIIPSTEEMIETMVEEEKAAEREGILKKMTPAFRKKFEYIENWFRQEIDNSLRRRYELGLQVRELQDDEQKNGGKLYGKNAIERISKLIRWNEGLIYASLRFVEAYTPEDLERLCAIVLPNGSPLSWTYVRTLVTVDKATTRQILLEKTISEGWTTLDLAYEVKNLDRDGQPIKDGRGRPSRVPTNFDSAVAQQKQSAEQWDRRFWSVWINAKHSLATHASKLSPDEITDERLRQSRELANYLRRVADQATEQAESAEQVVKEFEQILDQHQKSPMPVQTKITRLLESGV